MHKITVDNEVGTQLVSLEQPVEVVDEAGRRLGHFVPTEAQGAVADCPYIPADLERMRREEGGLPLSEIWKSLGAK